MPTDEPIPMLLWCPECGQRHVDEGGFKPHHTHACQNCGMVWRPAIVNTTGVQFLPGYKNDEDEEEDDEKDEKGRQIEPGFGVPNGHVWDLSLPKGRRYCKKCGALDKSAVPTCIPLIRRSNEPSMDSP